MQKGDEGSIDEGTLYQSNAFPEVQRKKYSHALVHQRMLNAAGTVMVPEWRL
jgi:hypothetical protein